MITKIPAARRIEFSLFTIPFISFAYFYQASDQSTGARFDLMRSILERGTLWIDGYCGYNTADIINLSGHYYSVKAPGTSLVALPVWALFRSVLLPLSNHHEPLYWALVTYLTIVFTTGLAISALCVVMYRFARFLGASDGRAAALALILAFATVMFPYATEMTGEPIAGAFLLIAFYLIATFDAGSHPSRAIWAGVLAGLGVLNDYPALVIAAAIGVYALHRFRISRALAGFALGAGMIAIIMFAYNWMAFGNPLFFSYQAYKLAGNAQFPEQSVGFVGITYPKLENLWRILADPQRGLFFCNPVLLLTIPAAGYFYGRRRWRAEWLVTGFSIVAMVLFNASYGTSIISWGGGTATGPRQIVAAIPFMVLVLAFLPRACNWLLGGLAALSAFIMLMATATNPHFPYEYDNPVRDFALQQFARGDFGTNRDGYFGDELILPDSIAFNLGKLLQLPGPSQLWLLGAFWIIGALELTDALTLFPRPSARRCGSMAIAIGIGAMFMLPLIEWIRRPLELIAVNGLLGQYFVGERAAITPPHIIRIDRAISFDDVASLGAMPFPSVVRWTGNLIVPTAGKYRFVMDVDDVGWLGIDGKPVIADPGSQNRFRAEGSVTLEAGNHRIEVGERNLGGGAAIHLNWQPPGQPEEPIPSEALTPDHP